jgi:hypothetical protein
MRRIKTSVVVGAAVLLLSAVGCGDDDDDGGDEGAGGTEVDVVLSEFIIEPSEDTVDAGEVTFNLDNQGGETHEFVVVDAASVDDLPLDEDEAFDESTYGEDNVLGEVEDVESGATAEWISAASRPTRRASNTMPNRVPTSCQRPSRSSSRMRTACKPTPASRSRSSSSAVSTRWSSAPRWEA